MQRSKQKTTDTLPGKIHLKNIQLKTISDSGPVPDSAAIRPRELPGRRRFNLAKRGDAFFDVLRGVDMIQDSLTIPDIENRLRAALKKERIDISFDITKQSAGYQEKSDTAVFETSNEVTVGFLRPIKFTLDLLNTPAYLFKKISSQIIISLLLVALTTVSFVVLYRNLVQQRRLTQLKNDFISNITHELKTPIATVSVAVEAMKSFNALADPKKTAEYLDISANELQRLSLLVDKVLRLSMFEKQEIELRKEQFDLKQLVLEVAASMRLQLEKTGAILRLDLPLSPVPLMADRLHITSVIYNLMDNALKYSGTNPFLTVGVKEKDNVVELVAADRGNGIPAEFQDKVFDKFFRVPTGDQHNVKGYGLGLSYVAY
ncbi:MAG: hypothetical protein EOO02_23445, partial [Chitinophagaceae bacterium]